MKRYEILYHDGYDQTFYVIAENTDEAYDFFKDACDNRYEPEDIYEYVEPVFLTKEDIYKEGYVF